jgi:hypothetical protein
MSYVVSENIILQAEKLAPEDDKAIFTYALVNGKIFKEHDLTPIYIVNPVEDSDNIYLIVTSAERIMKKFN